MEPTVDTDALGRQLEELEALCAIYTDDIEVDQTSREAIEQYVVGVRTDDGCLPLLSFRVQLTPHLQVQAILPSRYLAEGVWEPPMCFAANASQELLEDVISREYTGSECLLPVLQAMQELFRQPEEKYPEAMEDDEHAEVEYDKAFYALQESLHESRKPTQLGRRLMYSHHIRATSKRRAIIEWAKQLQLGGFSKIGYPGVIVVEGDEDNIRSYVDALTRLRWKHFVVRGEEIVSLPSGVSLDTMRKIPLQFQEFGTNEMGEIARRCKECGLEDLFKTCMKIYK